MTRIRTRAYGEAQTGSVVRTIPSGEIVYQDEYTSQGFQLTEDIIGSSWNFFSSESVDYVGSTLTGRNTYGPSWYSEFNNYPSTVRQLKPDYGVENLPSFEQLRLSAISSSNPNNDDGNLTNFIIELAELPALVKSLGTDALQYLRSRDLLKSFANANLALQFGILPMLSDAIGLAKFSGNVSKRLKQISDVRQYGGLVTEKRIGQYISDRTKDNFVFCSNGAFISGQLLDQTICEVWAAIKWVYDPSQSVVDLLNPDKSNDIAKSLALGGLLTYDISDLWEIIPFSWFVDYFTNIGKIADASNNIIGLKPTKGIMMRKYSNFRAHASYSDKNISLSAGGSTAVLKTRQPFSPFYSASDPPPILKKPLITPQQWANLASLFIMKRRGSNDNPYINAINSNL